MVEEARQRKASPSAPSRSYPNKRNRCDNGAIPAEANQASASSSDSTKLLEAFRAFRDEIDSHNDRRERLIKSSRDVTSLSKKVIFLLHRFDIHDFASETPSNKTRKLFSEAETKLEEIVALLRQAAAAEGLGSIQTQQEQLDASTKRLTSQRYERNIGGGLEEFIEAISFYHYLRTTRLISLSQIQDRFRTDPVPESHFYSPLSSQAISASQPPASDSSTLVALHIPTHRYLLGLSDLTGELMRFATNAVGQGDTGAVIKQVLSLTRQLRDGLDPFVPLVRDLNKKQSVTNQSLRKIEDILYAITVRSAEYGSDPKALQEMVRRTLASSSSAQNSSDDVD
ncbi:uncharacterized protein UTRI_06626 [Ustilago trichophora]|uniref:Translin n=1 Tax=Ustilago trichophora TaxID=86804 RepID=A0A5C3EP54_9BASI|nr:uncharacterized protein UTRI_06626 [Ustilago trichophora]